MSYRSRSQVMAVSRAVYRHAWTTKRPEPEQNRILAHSRWIECNVTEDDERLASFDMAKDTDGCVLLPEVVLDVAAVGGPHEARFTVLAKLAGAIPILRDPRLGKPALAPVLALVPSQMEETSRG